MNDNEIDKRPEVEGLTYEDFTWDYTIARWVDPMIEREVTETVANLLNRIRYLEGLLAFSERSAANYMLRTAK